MKWRLDAYIYIYIYRERERERELVDGLGVWGLVFRA